MSDGKVINPNPCHLYSPQSRVSRVRVGVGNCPQQCDGRLGVVERHPLSEAAKFLSENGFSQYVVGFESKGFETMRAIKLMNPSDIEACGVPTGHAKLIHAAIVALSPLPLSPSSPVDSRPELQALSTLQCGVDLTNGKSCNSVLQLIKPGVATKLIGSEIYPSDDVLVNTQMNEVKFSCEEVKSQKE